MQRSAAFGVVTALQFRTVKPHPMIFYKQYRNWDETAFLKWQV